MKYYQDANYVFHYFDVVLMELLTMSKDTKEMVVWVKKAIREGHSVRTLERCTKNNWKDEQYKRKSGR